MRRTAVGIDLGTTDVFAANVGQKGVGIVQNGVSERRTPALVSFTGRRRLIGDQASPQVRANFRNSCRGLKHLIGRALDCKDVNDERFWSLCPLAKADDGYVGYEVCYRGAQKCVSATVCLSMLVTAIVATCKTWTKMDVRDVVLAIPSYFTDGMRQACLDALRIAGVSCLRLLHETTAIALAWRFDRRSLDDANPVTVAFCSCGHSALFVAIARFEKGAVTILSEAYDRSVSGRTMDQILMEIFAESLKKQGAPDPLAGVKSKLKLEEAATKVKKTLSSVDEATGTAECVVEDYDMSCNVKRSRFEELCAPLHDKAKCVVAKALEGASLTAKDLAFVEIVGGACRVPWLQKALREAFDNKELSTTLNADEAVAKGCAWSAAMLSPHIRLNPIALKECGQLAIALQWKDSPNVEAEGSELIDGSRRLVIFEAQSGPNVEVEVSLRCQGQLELSAVYYSVEPLPPGADVPLGTWKLPFPGRQMEDVEIQCALDANGIFSIVKACVCSGKAAVEAEKKKAEEAAQAEAEKSGENGTKTNDTAGDEADKTAAADEKPVEGGEDAEQTAGAPEEVAEQTEGDQPSAGQEGTSASQDAANDEPPPDAQEVGGFDPAPRSKWRPSFNWKFWQWGRKVDQDNESKGFTGRAEKFKIGGRSRKDGATLKRETVKIALLQRPGYSSKSMTSAIQAEQNYRATDEAVTQAENARNDYEAHILALRHRITSRDALIMEWASPEERGDLSKELDEAEAWTYDHVDEEANAYVDRLKALQKKEKEIENRKVTLENIQEKVKALKKNIAKYKAMAVSPVFNHIAKDKLDSITADCDSTTQWINELEARQNTLKQWDAPAFSVTELTVRSGNFVNNSSKILSEPKPKASDAKKSKKLEKAKDKAAGQNDKDDKSSPEEGSKGDDDSVKENPGRSTVKSRKTLWWIVILMVVLIPGVLVLLGFGEPYGLPSPFSRSANEDADFEELAAEPPEPADPLEYQDSVPPPESGDQEEL